MSDWGDCPECGESWYNRSYFQRQLKCATCATSFPFCKGCFTPTNGWSLIDGYWTPAAAAGWSCIDCMNREHRRKLIANGYVGAASLLLEAEVDLDLAREQQETARSAQETCESPTK